MTCFVVAMERDKNDNILQEIHIQNILLCFVLCISFLGLTF